VNTIRQLTFCSRCEFDPVMSRSSSSDVPAIASQAGAPGLPLRMREDLEIAEIPFAGRLSYVVKDPLGLKYHRLEPLQYRLLTELRQPRSVEQLLQTLNAFEPSSQLEAGDVQRMLVDLHEKGLLISQRAGQGTQLWLAGQKEQRQEVLKSLKSFLFLRLPGWSPEPSLNLLEPLRHLLLHPVGLALQFAVILAGLLLVGREYAEFQSRLPAFQQFFQAGNLPYLWLSIVLTKIVHEVGHAMVCRHCGATPHQIGIMLLVFTPTLYCDVSDSWMLKNKWKRIAIGLGGPFFEATLASLALLIWWWTVPGLLHFVCLNIFLVSAITTVLFNLNPLIRFDGYYVLSDYLEIPNLKQQSDRALQRAFARHVLGVDLPHDPLTPESSNPWLLVYGVAAWCYRWVMVFGITMFLYSLLKPWGMANFSFLLASITLGMMVYALVRSLKNTLRQITPVQSSRLRTTVWSLLAVGAVAALLLIPVPYWLTCSFELEPRQSHHVHAMTAGFLQEVLVQPGEFVEAGQPVLRLKNPELIQEQQELQKQQEVIETRCVVARLRQDYESLSLAREQLESIEVQLRNVAEKIARLELVAPSAGRLFPAESKLDESDSDDDRLQQWDGTVFQKRNLSSWIAKGTPLFTVAADHSMQAVLLINQDDMSDLAVGQQVLLQCEPWAGEYFNGTIAELSTRETRIVPRALSEKGGGSVATISGKDGREQLLSPGYQGLVPMPQAALAHPRFLGVTGAARVVVSHRSTAGWVWRLLCQTFEFRL